MSDPYTVAHQFRTQALQEQQAKALARMADVAEAQIQLARKSQRSSTLIAIGSIVIAMGSLAVAILTLLLKS
jgi:hypothetical protein